MMDLERITRKSRLLVELDSNFILHSRCNCDCANKPGYKIIMDFVPFCNNEEKK